MHQAHGPGVILKVRISESERTTDLPGSLQPSDFSAMLVDMNLLLVSCELFPILNGNQQEGTDSYGKWVPFRWRIPPGVTEPSYGRAQITECNDE